jgi:DNA polymerase III subunit delta'
MTEFDEFSPKTATRLFGHEEAQQLLIRDMVSGKMPHGWIFSGGEGIGKATLAYRFARALLAGKTTLDMSGDDPVFRRVAAGSHTDMLVIEPLHDPKKDEKNQIIPVEQVRAIGEFLSLTPGESERRVVLIDPADALNNNSANAILKILEEPPPQAVIILISHNSGRLLPTIRSRCRLLKLKPLEDEQFSHVMRQIAPGNSAEYIQTLGVLSNDAPGVGVVLHEKKAVERYSQLIDLLMGLPTFDSQKLHAFADQIGSGSVHSNWQLFTRLMLCVLSRATKMSVGSVVNPVSDEEGALLAKLAAFYPAAVWAAKWQQAMDQFLLAERLHLDYKQVVITYIHSLTTTEGFQLGHAAA